jgi:hypothetical protein
MLDLHKSLLEGLEESSGESRSDKRKELSDEEMEKVIDQFEKKENFRGDRR